MRDQDPIMSNSGTSTQLEKETDMRAQPIMDDSANDSASPAVAAEKPETTSHHFPEGGLTAWLVVGGCWCVSFVSFGYVNSFGVYETYYLQHFLSAYTPSDVAWIGSIQAFAQFSANLISGPVADRYGPRVVLWPCSLLLVLAMMLTSLCTRYYQFILCQGVLLGTSAGLLYAPALSVVGHYFHRRRALAMSLASTGSPVGGIVFPIILTNLIHGEATVGFAWAQRVCGFLALVLVGLGCAAIRPSAPRRRKGGFLLLSAFRNPVFSLQVAALFMVILGLWTPYFYLADYGALHGMDAELASYLFALLNGGSFLGRVVAGMVASRLGAFNVATAACYASAILLFCWLRIDTAAGLVMLAVLFGAMSGVIIALMFPTISQTANHPSKIGTYVGQATFVIGFAGLAGTPITGALIHVYGGYTQGIVFSASSLMAGAVLYSLARYLYARDKLTV